MLMEHVAQEATAELQKEEAAITQLCCFLRSRGDISHGSSPQELTSDKALNYWAICYSVDLHQGKCKTRLYS